MIKTVNTPFNYICHSCESKEAHKAETRTEYIEACKNCKDNALQHLVK